MSNKKAPQIAEELPEQRLVTAVDLAQFYATLRGMRIQSLSKQLRLLKTEFRDLYEGAVLFIKEYKRPSWQLGATFYQDAWTNALRLGFDGKKSKTRPPATEVSLVNDFMNELRELLWQRQALKNQKEL